MFSEFILNLAKQYSRNHQVIQPQPSCSSQKKQEKISGDSNFKAVSPTGLHFTVREEKNVQFMITRSIGNVKVPKEGVRVSAVASSEFIHTENYFRSVSSDPEKSSMSTARSIALVVTVRGASFMNTLSVQAVIILLHTIGQDIGILDNRLQWIVSAYSLTVGCFLLLWAASPISTSSAPYSLTEPLDSPA